MSRKIKCRYCNKPFIQSRYHPKQGVCSSEACQRRRKSDYHRKKLAEDAEYWSDARVTQKLIAA